MAGYDGYSMSNNARLAYECGEKPLSKWTKSALLDGCGEKAGMLSRLTVKELRDALLICTGWHHTSDHYNRTDFYGIDDGKLAEIDENAVSAIISGRAPREKKVKEEPKKITAEITFTVWIGNYSHYKKKKVVTETVTFTEGDKMIETSYGKKRTSSIDNIVVIK